MRRFLLASVATAGLTFAALPALAQTQVPNLVPATPPITTPAPEADVTTEEQLGAAVQSPDAAAAVTGEAQAQAPTIASPAQTAEGTPQAAQATPEPVTPPAATAETTPAPAATAHADAAIVTPASASDVCAMRTTSVHFGARGSALSQQNRNAIEHAADAASVCNLQTVAIIDSAQGGTHSRRASAIRAALVRQGVPEDRITVEEASADVDASRTGRVDVRMNFAGVSNDSTVVADATPATGVNAAANPTLRTTMTPTPETAPAAPEATPAASPDAAPPMPEPQEGEPAATPGT
jgi:outer membrane protein OmpA-like peptidoglycan-associated protein